MTYAALVSTKETGLSVPASGLVGWYEADALSDTHSNGGAVASWTDKSGLGNHATQGTGGNQPTFQTNVVNGRPIIRFNGTTAQWLVLPNVFSGATSVEGFFLQKSAANPAPDNARAGWMLFSTGSTSHYPYIDGNVYAGFGAGRQSLGTFGGTTITNFHLANFRSRAGTTWLAVANGRPTWFVSAGATLVLPTAPEIGRSDSTYRYSGDVAMILLYNRSLTDTERGQVADYVTTKYAIALS